MNNLEIGRHRLNIGRCGEVFRFNPFAVVNRGQNLGDIHPSLRREMGGKSGESCHPVFF